MSDWRVAKSLGATGKDGLLGEINYSAPRRNKDEDGAIGDTSHTGRPSDHNPNKNGVVQARDFTHDPKGGFDCHIFVAWLIDRLRMGQEKRVKYVIWMRKIYSGVGQRHPVGIGRAYTGSNPHDKHCHVSVRDDPKLYDDESSWGWLSDTPLPPKQKLCPTCGQKI